MKINDLEILDLNEEENEDWETVDFPDEEKFDWKKETKSFAFTFLITLAVVIVLKTFVIINATVPTGSVQHT